MRQDPLLLDPEKSYVDTLRLPRLAIKTWLGALLVALGAVWIAYQLATNPSLEWDVIGEYIFSPHILSGVWVTVALTALTMVLGTLLGILLAVMRLSQNPVLEIASGSFIWFFRSTPALVQLIFWYNLASLFPEISIGIPFDGPKLMEWDTNVLVTSFIAALLGLGLNEAAYMAEIVRGGILSVDPSQREAASALGMKPWRTFIRVTLPQAMRAIIPPTGNQVIGMLKYTSLASVVAVSELLNAAQDIYNRTFQTIPLLIVASIWYLVLTSVLSLIQAKIETHYSRGDRQPQQTAWTRSIGVVLHGSRRRRRGSSPKSGSIGVGDE